MPRSPLFFLSRRIGFAAAVAAVFGLFALTVILVNSTFAPLEEHASVVRHERKVRIGYAALSDLQRISNNMLVAAQESYSEAALRSLSRSNDMLFARGWTIVTEDLQEPSMQGRVLLAERLQDTANLVERYIDTLRVSGPAAAGADFDAVVIAMEQSRVAAIQFIDAQRRLHDTLVAAHEKLLTRQGRMLYGFSLALALIGVTALAMLRREIVLRQEREQARRRAEYLAYHDPLTGLANRVRFADLVRKSLAETASTTVIMMDIDRFKDVNDRMGHAAGDTVLRSMAMRLSRAAVARGGFAARLAGDEFAACLPVDDRDVILDFAESLVSEAAVPIWHERGRIVSGLSLGIASARQVAPSGHADFETMLRIADFALYYSKEHGRGRYTLYDAALEGEYTERRALLADLRAAVELGAIDIQMQPKVEIDTGETYGFEALARWNRMGRAVRPSLFVRLAEEAGFVAEIDRIVLRDAVHQIARWNRLHGTDFSLSVNLSGLDFADHDLVGFVRNVLETAQLSPALLTLEITETVRLGDWSRIGTTIQALRDLGCRIAIDDFGAGYSSLAYLRQVQADELKIDRSLVTEVESSGQARFILDTVVELAHTHLGFDVVVEGVETESQVQALRAIGCRRAQGYYFGRPASVEVALERATQERNRSVTA